MLQPSYAAGPSPLQTGRDTPALNDPVARFLAQCPLLSNASETTRHGLTRVAASRLVARNKPVVLQGTPWPFLGIVRSGKISAVVSSSEGREQILYEAVAAETFGEIMLFDRGDSVARFATLSEPAEVLLLPRDDVMRAMLVDEGLRTELSVACARRMRSIVELLCAHVSKPVIARIAMLLCRHAGDSATIPAGGTETSLTLAQIAAASGTVKEVVARSLLRLENDGAIRRQRGRIFVLDVEKLTTFI